MKKKIAAIILISMMLVVIAAICFIKSRPPIIVQGIAENVYLADSTEELKGLSDYIVVATIRKTKNSPEHVEDVGLVAGFTYTDLNIEQVIKGDLKPGSVFSIREDYYTTDWGRYLYPIDGYVPMKKGQKYLLFLKYDDFIEQYRVFDLNYSKYVIFDDRTPDSFSEEDRELLQVGDLTDMKKYLDWYEDIMGEYDSTGTLEWTDIPEEDEKLGGLYVEEKIAAQ